jgi:hypothetical protein
MNNNISLNEQLQKAGVVKRLPHNTQDAWIRNNEPGLLYPRQARVVPVLMQNDSFKWVCIDETGWDGFERIPNQLVGVFDTEEKAWEKAEEVISEN